MLRKFPSTLSAIPYDVAVLWCVVCYTSPKITCVLLTAFMEVSFDRIFLSPSISIEVDFLCVFWIPHLLNASSCFGCFFERSLYVVTFVLRFGLSDPMSFVRHFVPAVIFVFYKTHVLCELFRTGLFHLQMHISDGNSIIFFIAACAFNFDSGSIQDFFFSTFSAPFLVICVRECPLLHGTALFEVSAFLTLHLLSFFAFFLLFCVILLCIWLLRFFI